MKFNITGKSLLELREEFGVGSSGFCDNSWWLNEPFAKEKPDAGVYEIDFEARLNNLTFNEQKSKTKKGFVPIHPAVLAEAVLNHYKKTGKRLLENWYSRTNVVVSDGSLAYVGFFDSGGLLVDYSSWDDSRSDIVGLASAWKSQTLNTGDLEPLESLSLDRKTIQITIDKKIYEATLKEKQN